MPVGLVEFFNAQKGYGLIKPEDGGKPVFLPMSEVAKAEFATLAAGTKVEYELETKPRGAVRATKLKKVSPGQ